MTEQNDRPLRLSDREPCGGHIVSQSGCRVLNHADVETVLLQIVAAPCPRRERPSRPSGWCGVDEISKKAMDNI
jgi:hypothetical protein